MLGDTYYMKKKKKIRAPSDTAWYDHSPRVTYPGYPDQTLLFQYETSLCTKEHCIKISQEWSLKTELLQGNQWEGLWSYTVLWATQGQTLHFQYESLFCTKDHCVKISQGLVQCNKLSHGNHCVYRWKTTLTIPTMTVMQESYHKTTVKFCNKKKKI